MKNLINISIILLAVICMSNSSCNKKSIDNIRTAAYDELFELSLEEQIILPKEPKEIIVSLSAINDSRCPKDVQCVWAGNATAELTFMSESGTKTSASLCIGDCKDKNDSLAIILDNKNYLVTLSAINNSQSGANITPKAKIKIKKL